MPCKEVGSINLVLSCQGDQPEAEDVELRRAPDDSASFIGIDPNISMGEERAGAKDGEGNEADAFGDGGAFEDNFEMPPVEEEERGEERPPRFSEVSTIAAAPSPGKEPSRRTDGARCS